MSLFKNTASQRIRVFAFDATTGLPKSGDAANLTAYIAKDYGSVTALGDTSATEEDSTNAKGYYWFDITQTETNADNIMVTAKSSTSNIVVVGAPAIVATRPPNAGALVIDGSGRVDVSKVAGSSTAATNLANAYAAIETGTAQGGGASTIRLRAGASDVVDYYKDQSVFILSGTGAGQTNRITAYTGNTGTTHNCTVETAWATQPDNTSVYLVLGRIG